MIDFRYHLVSLVSVFLALAVGIVLGAGPLKETIGSTLTAQVQVLRQEKDDLHTQLDTSTAAVSHRDDFVSAITPNLIGDQLTGRSVAIVVLPGADGSVVDPLTQAITQAGGTVTGRVTLNSGWVNPAQEQSRDKAVSDLLADLPPGTIPVAADTSRMLPDLLAAALVSTGVGRSTSTSTDILKGLREADLIGVKGNFASFAGAALLVAPANETSDQKAPATPSADVVDASYTALAIALDGTGGGAVVTGPPSAASGNGVLAAIRKDDTAKSAVSTVDTGGTPMGVVTAVIALREQLQGRSGAYGFVSGDASPLPTLTTAPATPVTSSPVAGATRPTAITK